MKTSRSRYKYFTFEKDGIFAKHELVHTFEIGRIARNLRDKKYSAFQTIQTYDENGENPSCPIYFDFDGDTALEDTRHAVNLINKLYGVRPLIYFSGSKGFHLILFYTVYGSNCHKYVRKFVERLDKGWASLDYKVYTARRLFRIPGSFHTKSGLYKILLPDSEFFSLSLEDIREKAKQIPESKDLYSGKDFKWLKTRRLTDEFNEIKEDLINTPKPRPQVVDGTWKDNVTPCLKHMFENEPEEGAWNTTIVVLGNFLKRFGVSLDEALGIMYNNQYFVADEAHVERVLGSIFSRDGEYTQTCKQDNIFAKHMINYCSNSCIWYKKED